MSDIVNGSERCKQASPHAIIVDISVKDTGGTRSSAVPFPVPNIGY